MAKVIEVEVPAASGLSRTLKRVDFSDAYQVSLSGELAVEDIYEGMFSHASKSVRALFAARDVAARALGLKRASGGPGRTGPAPRPYRVGQRVGMFIVQSIEPGELIVGIDDKHLDVRISVLRSTVAEVETATISTAVEIHNALGAAYMFVIKPFHRLIARQGMQDAADTGRL